MEITIKLHSGNEYLFENVQTNLWHLQFRDGKPYIQECNGNMVHGEEVGYEAEAREEIAYLLADEGIEKTPEQIAEIAKEAVDYYFDDAIRAECWNHAIGVIVENS